MAGLRRAKGTHLVSGSNCPCMLLHHLGKRGAGEGGGSFISSLVALSMTPDKTAPINPPASKADPSCHHSDRLWAPRAAHFLFETTVAPPARKSSSYSWKSCAFKSLASKKICFKRKTIFVFESFSLRIGSADYVIRLRLKRKKVFEKLLQAET